jgi:hypothetical protein
MKLDFLRENNLEPRVLILNTNIASAPRPYFVQYLKEQFENCKILFASDKLFNIDSITVISLNTSRASELFSGQKRSIEYKEGNSHYDGE